MSSRYSPNNKKTKDSQGQNVAITAWYVMLVVLLLLVVVGVIVSVVSSYQIPTNNEQIFAVPTTTNAFRFQGAPVDLRVKVRYKVNVSTSQLMTLSSVENTVGSIMSQATDQAPADASINVVTQAIGLSLFDAEGVDGVSVRGTLVPSGGLAQTVIFNKGCVNAL